MNTTVFICWLIQGTKGYKFRKKNCNDSFICFVFCFVAGAKPFACDQCGAQFSQEDALEAHRQTHTGRLLKMLPKGPSSF